MKSAEVQDFSFRKRTTMKEQQTLTKEQEKGNIIYFKEKITLFSKLWHLTQQDK